LNLIEDLQIDLPPLKDQEYQAVRIIGKDSRCSLLEAGVKRNNLHENLLWRDCLAPIWRKGRDHG
jgi:hypothetical protein